MKLNGIIPKIKNIMSYKKVSLCLHIGMPKTGTTAIQHFLNQNRQALISNGILYPKCGIPEFQHAALVKSIVSQHYPWAKFNDAIDHFDPAAYINEVVEESRQRQCTRVIMSSEFFWAAPAMQSDLPYHTVSPENLEYLEGFVRRCRELFRVFDKTQIVVYLRRQDVWLDSFFGQQIKDGFAIPEDLQLLDPKVYLLYSENLKMWSEAFGKENILVRVYDEHIPDVIDDFCDLIGLPASQLVKPDCDAETVNNRLTPLAADITQKALALNIDSQSLALLKNILKSTSFELIRKHQQSGVRTFTKEFFVSIFSVYLEENKKLIKMFPLVENIHGIPPKEYHETVSFEHHCFEQETQQLIANLLTLIGDNANIKKITN